MRPGLSKSKIAAFEQCPRRLWLSVHRPDLQKPSEDEGGRMDESLAVGELARSLTKGLLIDNPDLTAAEHLTRELIQSGHRDAIFEATFIHGGVLVQVDILEPDGDDWAIREVKSSTSAKKEHVSDLATQVWVVSGAGLMINDATIRHINNGFVLNSEGDYSGFFTDAFVLDAVTALVADRHSVVEQAGALLEDTEPVCGTGSHCDKPYPCGFTSHCDAELPPAPDWPVALLPNGGGRKFIAKGVTDLLQVNSVDITNPMHLRIFEATLDGRPYHDVEAALVATCDWSFPRVWLDFETIAFAIPRWIGTKPYEQVPFQFSAHVESLDGEIRHFEFLSLDGTDPRRHCAEALVALPSEGAVITYNASFERGCIERLAAACPDLESPLRSLCSRIVDLLPVARSTWYHRDQRGSWSIKAILPTVAPQLSYDNLDVKDGGAAQSAYLEAISPATSIERRRMIETGLRAYCERDTEAMIVLARHLCSQS